MSLYDDFEPRRPKTRRSRRLQSQEQNRRLPAAKASPQAPRLKVTVQRPDQLDALAKKLGLSKAAVCNLALAELAARMGSAECSCMRRSHTPGEGNKRLGTSGGT
jgi:hypothetical protein